MISRMTSILSLWILKGTCLPRREGKHRCEVCLGVKLHIHLCHCCVIDTRCIKLYMGGDIPCDFSELDLEVAGLIQTCLDWGVLLIMCSGAVFNYILWCFVKSPRLLVKNDWKLDDRTDRHEGSLVMNERGVKVLEKQHQHQRRSTRGDVGIRAKQPRQCSADVSDPR